MNEAELASGYPELLADLADQIACKLLEFGIEPERAAEAGFAAAEHIRANWSGQSLYVPKGVEYELSKRDMVIFERCNGRNHEVLAREYNLTVMRIYQIIKAVKAELLRKRQGALFET
ncbi:MAG: Mor transcription activator family protein [Burkholderiales bacterium]|nr:Mor transcription activator family protein [Burkholderiales bacterium]